MNKYITYIIYIIVAFVIVIGGFLLYTFLKKNNENVPGKFLSMAELLLTIPAPQLAFYSIVLIALISIVIYNIFKPKYGLPSSVFKFCYNKPYDTQTQYLYQHNKTKTYIPEGVLPSNNGKSSTYGIWLYVTGVDNGIITKKNEVSNWKRTPYLKHVLSRGSSTDPIIGLYLKEDINDLVLKIKTSGQSNKSETPETITLENIPLNRWFQVVLTITQNKNINIYMNGRLIKPYVLKGVLLDTKNTNIYIGNLFSKSLSSYSGFIFKGFYSSTALADNIINSVYNKQKKQVAAYYKKYLEPLVKKNAIPICEPSKKK